LALSLPPKPEPATGWYGFVKKGSDSIGVARQYCGTIGKVDNCQVGVFAAYASPQGYALIDKRLFIPEKWFAKDYAAKREKCALPENIKFKTKPQLAVEMFTAIRDEGILPFKYIATDSLYGSSPEFINAVDRLPGITYFVSMASDTRCWLKRPVVREKTYKYKGTVKTRKILEDTSKAPIAFIIYPWNLSSPYQWNWHGTEDFLNPKRRTGGCGPS
jgi:SRSO17 transposase